MIVFRFVHGYFLNLYLVNAPGGLLSFIPTYSTSRRMAVLRGGILMEKGNIFSRKAFGAGFFHGTSSIFIDD